MYTHIMPSTVSLIEQTQCPCYALIIKSQTMAFDWYSDPWQKAYCSQLLGQRACSEPIFGANSKRRPNVCYKSVDAEAAERRSSMKQLDARVYFIYAKPSKRNETKSDREPQIWGAPPGQWLIRHLRWEAGNTQTLRRVLCPARTRMCDPLGCALFI